MKKVFINHKLYDMENANTSIHDRGYVFGDGVYEVIRFYNGVLFKLDEHLERFKRSVQEIDVSFVFDMEKLKREMEFLIITSGYNSGYVYAQISRGIAKRDHVYIGREISEPQYVMYVVQEEERPLESMEKGVKVLLTEDIRWSRCDIKSLNLLGSVMMKNEAAKRGAKEAVLFRNGIVTEGSATNVFVVKNGVLYTHPPDNFILNGITRLTVIQVAEKLGIQVKEVPFSVEFFRDADEAFTTASVSEITPIVSYEYEMNGEPLTFNMGNGKKGEVTARIQTGYGECIEE